MSISLESTLIILPCFNEEESLTVLLPELAKTVPRSNILVLDDGSVDGTNSIAKSMGFKCLRLMQNCGIGGTVQTGFIYALQNGFSGVIQLDGDGQHPPDQITKLIECAKSESADLVIGSRFFGLTSFKSSQTRRLGINLISLILKILFKTDIKDTTSGFRYYGTSALKLFSQEYPTDYPEPIALALASEHNFKIVETAVLMRERLGGSSSIFGYRALKYMVRVLGYICLIRLGRHV